MKDNFINSAGSVSFYPTNIKLFHIFGRIIEFNVILYPAQITTQPRLLLDLWFSFSIPEFIKSYKLRLFGAALFFNWSSCACIHHQGRPCTWYHRSIFAHSDHPKTENSHWTLDLPFCIKLPRCAIHVHSVIRCPLTWLWIALSWHPPLPQYKSNMRLLDHIINDIYIIASIGLDLMDMDPLNCPLSLLIFTHMLCNLQIVISGVDFVRCQYVAGRGAMKVVVHVWVGLVIILIQIKVIDCVNGFKEFLIFGMLVSGCLYLV